MNFVKEKKSYKASALSLINYYSMDKKHSTFFAVRFKLDEKIKKDLLQKALDKTIKRFPYFNRKLVFTKKDVLIQDYEKPLLVHEEELDRIINFNTNDGHLIRIQMCGEYLTFQAFHGLTDATGAYRFTKILLENYYSLKGEDIKLQDDIYHHDEVSKDEYLFAEDLDNLDGLDNPKEVKRDVYVIKEKDTGFYTNVFSCDAQKFMDFAKAIDGSPNAVLTILLAKAIKDINPSYDKEINIGVAVNVKNFIGLNYSYPPLISTADQAFNEKIFNMDDEMMHTVVRGRIILDSSEDELLKFTSKVVKSVPPLIDALPTFKSRQLLALQSTNTVRNTASVSYVGKFDFGDVEKHIVETYTFCDSKTPILEISYVNGLFFFSLTTKFDNDAYILKIKELCDEYKLEPGEIQKIVFKVDEGKTKLAKFGLNSETIQLITTAKKMTKK